MPSSRSCRSSYDCIVKIKGVTMRPILFSQLMRSDGEGAMNPEELFADDRSPASEQERVHEDELHSLMRSILDWAISFLSESSQARPSSSTARRSTSPSTRFTSAWRARTPSSRRSSSRNWRGSTTRRAPSSRPCSGLAVAMRNEQVEAVQGEMLHRDSDEPLVASELNEAATTAALPRELRQDASAAACDEPCARCGSIGVRVSYAGECSIEEAVSRYLAARENVRDVIGDGPA